MAPLEEGSGPAAAAHWLAVHGPACWQRADGAALAAACAAVPDGELAAWPGVARWRALAALLVDGAEALPCLAQAHAGHVAAGDAAAARLDAHIALALCLIDVGAMEGVDDWVARSLAVLPAAVPPDRQAAAWEALWLGLGAAARAVLSPAHGQGAGLALAQLHSHLQPLGSPLAAHERLLVAQVLVNAHFARQQFEQFDRLQAVVEAPAAFSAAPALMRARWHHTLGFACYQVGRWAAAEAAWQQALDLARAHPADLPHQGLLATLAMLRLLLDRQRLDEARQIEAGIDPRWGAGRPMQLMWLQQMRARLALLGGQPARARATLEEALALADQAGLSESERGGLHTDQVQLLLALGLDEAAETLLERLARPAAEPPGRDTQVFQCLRGLLRASRLQAADGPGARVALQSALRQAQALRYTMFWRLLPARAAEVCALALQWQVEAAFAEEVVRERSLPAPAGAGHRWPWALWLRLLGGFELRLQGRPLPRQGKPQAKPLELLRLLGCSPEMACPMRRAADALWPDSEGAAAHKSLEMTVQRCRRLLGDDSLLRVHDGLLSLDPARASSDLQQRGIVSRGLQALAMQPGADALADLPPALVAVQALLAITPDPAALLLPGAPDTPWLLACRHEAAQDLQRAGRAAQAVLARADAAAAATGQAGSPGHPAWPAREALALAVAALAAKAPPPA